MKKIAVMWFVLCLALVGANADEPAGNQGNALVDEMRRSMVIMEPEDGTLVRPGEKTTIVVRLKDHPNLEYIRAVDLTGAADYDRNRATEPAEDGLWQVPVRIPRDAIGERQFRIVAGLRTGDGLLEVEGSSLELAIDLEGIEVKLFAMKPAKIFCDPQKESEAQLIVRARFSDGEARDMTKGKVGTRYRSSNREVAEVDADGKVTCLAPGRALVFAELDENSAQATIVVEEPQP
ncbi:hypothetical protein ABI59_18180 [Acidobacteria bacterium Mor1]|nr:hypothetical protein ABI59_18180 [Acidobacteria bacterium Mor1]